MSIIEALEEMEQAPLGNARLEALKKCDSADLREMLVFSLSPQITFGVKKLPQVETYAVPGWGDSFQQVFRRLLTRLQKRELTGNEAQEAIRGFLFGCNLGEAKWAERIIRQDLRLNIGAKDVNNTLGEGTVFQFAVPLAEPYQDVDPKHYLGKWAVEPKLDGARTVAFLPANKGPVSLLSRSGKAFGNFESVRRKLQEINDQRDGGPDLVLDGEVVAIVNDRHDFQALQSNLFRKDGKEVGLLRYLVWDLATGTEWSNPAQTYGERYQACRKFVERALMDVPGSVSKLGLVPMFATTIDQNTAGAALMRRHSDKFVEDGYEGAIYRLIDAVPKMKRSRGLLKVKTFFDAEADVVGVVEGQGRLAGMLGTVVCKNADGNTFEIGSGFTDAQRVAFWKEKLALPKRINYKYQELTDAGIPRFPIFRGFRHEDDQ